MTERTFVTSLLRSKSVCYTFIYLIYFLLSDEIKMSYYWSKFNHSKVETFPLCVLLKDSTSELAMLFCALSV